MNKADDIIQQIGTARVDACLWWETIVRKNAAFARTQSLLESAEKLVGLSPLDWHHALGQAVVELIAERRKLLSNRDFLATDIEHGEHTSASGRLLLFEPGLTMSDGLAKKLTDGFLDVHNCPPPGLWLGYLFRGYTLNGETIADDVLISWIPDSEIGRVSDGIDINAEGCISWADSEWSVNTSLKQMLNCIS